MAISTSQATLVNSSQLGGTQTNVQTAALANGGYVVAWTTDTGGQKDVIFQRFDELGNKIGGPVTANSTVNGDQVLTDILARADGSFVLCWTRGGTVTTRGFDGATGLALTGESTINTVGAAATGAQIILTGAGSYKVVMSSNSGGNTVIEQEDFFASGGANGDKSVVTSLVPSGLSIREVVDGNNVGSQFILLSDGRVVSSTNGSAQDFGDAADILKLQTGLHVLADEAAMNAMLIGLTGLGSSMGGYSAGPGQVSGGIDAESPTAPDVYARKLVDLGNGRVLVVWVADTGTDPNAIADEDGIYAAVYDTTSGAFIDNGAHLVKGYGQGDAAATADLQAITLEASLMADGRVVLSWSDNSGLSGIDVRTAVLDPRLDESGHFIRAATEGDDVVVASKDATSSTLSGGGGNDTIIGFFSDDSVDGGDGDDVIDTAEGNDFVQGGNGRDFIASGSGDDVVYGGAGNDVISAGTGQDMVYGGDGNDTIGGDAGLDVIDGGDGIDTLTFAVFEPSNLPGILYTDLDYNASPPGFLDGYFSGDSYIINVENLIGLGDDDYLAGNAGVNVLRGIEGDDYLQGRGGADRMRGGAGRDKFVYEFANEGGDLIRGFDLASDKILIVSDNFGGIDEQSILASLNINSNGTAQSGGAKFMFDNSGTGIGQLYFDADGSASGTARVLLATIRFNDDLGPSLFSASNFEFV